MPLLYLVCLYPILLKPLLSYLSKAFLKVFLIPYLSSIPFLLALLFSKHLAYSLYPLFLLFTALKVLFYISISLTINYIPCLAISPITYLLKIYTPLVN